MKRIFFTILLSLAVFGAQAQTMHDALTFSQNDYYGTARSIGMGNAMTAVGGDLGSIGINPAGSAVSGYSQFTITPNLTVSSSNASYSAYPINGNDVYINERNKSYTRFSMPNFGVTYNFNTGKKSGLKAITYGFVFNGTNNFTDKMMAGGANDKTSYLSSMAVGADGWDVDVLNGYMDNNGNKIDDANYAYNNTNASFNTIVNAQAGAISTYGDSKDKDYYTRYIAATEGYTAKGDGTYDIFLGGPLNQAYGRQTYGSKNDFLFNIGFNISDVFYIGGNLGVTSLNYNYDEYFKEAAQNTNDFPIVLLDNNNSEYTIYFDNYRTRYSYTADGTGVYGKIGFIAKPAEGLRIGAAEQTPTVMHIDERWQQSVDIHYQGASAGSATTPEGNFSYNLRTPYRLNAGIAYTFMGMAMLSADYEMIDYSTMRFRTRDYADDTFDSVNNDIRDCMGVSHTLRLGAEFKPAPEIAVRAGYNFTTTPEYWYNNNSVKQTLNDKINAFSVGLGYSSNGSFFADLAGRLTMLADEYISPYADYLSDCASPLILNKRERWSLTATFGWRF